jgi:hypothetical protein
MLLLSLGGIRLNRGMRMTGQAPVDSGRELHGDEVERALEAQGEDLGEAPA